MGKVLQNAECLLYIDGIQDRTSVLHFLQKRFTVKKNDSWCVHMCMHAHAHSLKLPIHT